MGKMIFEELTIKNVVLKNRVVAAPMGTSTRTAEDGFVTDDVVEHFKEVSEGGPGLIIQGATAVDGSNKAHEDQCGVWLDEHVEGLKRITQVVHGNGTKIFLQLEHAGIRGLPEHPFAPSEFTLENRDGSKKICHVMTEEEIRNVEDLYAKAAGRAYAAGYDGIEVHDGHGWLLSAFTSPCINRRTDKYGQDLLLIVREIIEKIKNVVPDDFVIGLKMGAFNPDLETGLNQGREFEKMGFDYLHMSNNITTKWLPQNMWAPEGYPFSGHEYSCGEMKKSVGIPVIGAKNIRTLEEAQAVLDLTDIDMITMGRAFLADPYHVKKVAEGKTPNLCFHCPGRCQWKLVGKGCPARTKK